MEGTTGPERIGETMREDRGRTTIDAMVARGELAEVDRGVGRAQAGQLLARAHEQLVTARAVSQTDAAGAYRLLHDAARNALVAVLESEGLRPTRQGGHLAVRDAALARFAPPMGSVIRPFGRMCRRIHEVPRVLTEDVVNDLPKARHIVAFADREVGDAR